MRRITLPRAAGALACLGAALGLGSPAQAEGPEDLGALFSVECASCHAMPDPELRMDLAWLDQIRRTT